MGVESEIINLIDDLHITTEKLKLVLQEISSKRAEVNLKQKIHDQLFAENQELSKKLEAVKSKNLSVNRKKNYSNKYGFGSNTTCFSMKGAYQCKLSGLLPHIEREEIRKYFSSFGEVVHVDLIPDGIKRWNLKLADAIIFFKSKPKDSLFDSRHFLREREVKLIPRELSNVIKPSAILNDETKNADTRNSKSKFERTYSTTSTIVANNAKSRSVIVTEEYLPFLTNLNLEAFFAIYGKVIKITPFKSKRSKKPLANHIRQFFMKFENYQAAEASLGNHRIGTKILRVKLAKDF